MIIKENKGKGTVDVQIDYYSDLSNALFELNQMNIQGIFENDIDAKGLLELVNFLYNFNEISFKMKQDDLEE